MPVDEFLSQPFHQEYENGQSGGEHLDTWQRWPSTASIEAIFPIRDMFGKNLSNTVISKKSPWSSQLYQLSNSVCMSYVGTDDKGGGGCIHVLPRM